MHILIIEDDAAFCREVRDFLENSLYQVTVLTEWISATYAGSHECNTKIPAANTGSHGYNTKIPAASAGSHGCNTKIPAAITGSHECNTKIPTASTGSHGCNTKIPTVSTGSHGCNTKIPTVSADSHGCNAEQETSRQHAPEYDHIAQQVSAIHPDLILLDLNLPGKSGFEICAEIRETSDVPIIFVTGRTDSMDEVTALLKGGDDYVTKPFHPSLLLAHISAVLKRTRRNTELPKLMHRGLELDLSRGCIRCGDKSTELTKNELKILSCLFRHKGDIVSRMELIEYLWDNSIFIDDNSLSVHITRIRSKLEEIGVSDFIRTKRGMGYSI